MIVALVVIYCMLVFYKSINGSPKVEQSVPYAYMTDQDYDIYQRTILVPLDINCRFYRSIHLKLLNFDGASSTIDFSSVLIPSTTTFKAPKAIRGWKQKAKPSPNRKAELNNSLNGSTTEDMFSFPSKLSSTLLLNGSYSTDSKRPINSQVKLQSTTSSSIISRSRLQRKHRQLQRRQRKKNYTRYRKLLEQHNKSQNHNQFLQLLTSLQPESEQRTIIIKKGINNFNFSDVLEFFKDFERRIQNVEQMHDLSQYTVTATPQPFITSLDDIFISVKTTKKYHDTRIALIIKTWFQLAFEQIWFFTDSDDLYYQELTKNHLINTNCSEGHSRKALCCKMSAELDVFLESGKKWFCHFDDDNYVNVPRLLELLKEHNPNFDWYLGKPSISSPLEIHLDSKITTKNKIKFLFATGGAGFCLSRTLTLKMLPIAGGGKFMNIGDRIRFPDDVTMGFIIEYLLNVPLTIIDNFHSHLEPMEMIEADDFQDQISFSYVRMKNQWNVLKINGFDVETDPKRIYSLHCRLFPHFVFCPH